MRKDLATGVPPFDRTFFGAAERFTRIGTGAVGGKASGLLFIKDILASRLDAAAVRPFDVGVPTLTVLTTELFDQFLDQNHLRGIEGSGLPDDRIAHAFQRADLPPSLLGDLRALVDHVRTPLAVRSSSLLEDALYEPFAGVYATKMIPNNQPDADVRFRRLAEAVKFVYASTFFAGARNYLTMTHHPPGEEKMAVIIQEVVGRRHRDRFYPDVSGVGRSYSFYRSGHTRPEDGVVNLALGLGKTIVDGGTAWTYSPAHPMAPAPFGSTRDLLRRTQVDFWAVNMGKPPEYDPTKETEYLVRASLPDAEDDGALRYLVSTYDPQSDRLATGLRPYGARVLTFAPLLTLDELPFNRLVRALLETCEEALDAPVEVEFAVTLDDDRDEARLGFLQVRPMVVSDDVVEVPERTPPGLHEIVRSASVMGNGAIESITDVVFVKPDTFEARHTPAIARELGALNRSLAGEGRPYLLVGFGRWGSSDPWLGIPVEWPDINAARAIVEASLPSMHVDMSQGSHFFHNISAFRVCYFSVRHTHERIDWEWLHSLPVVAETTFVRHARAPAPVLVTVDGRTGHGVIAARSSA